MRPPFRFMHKRQNGTKPARMVSTWLIGCEMNEPRETTLGSFNW
jgi:hypothetical protein